MTEHHNPDIRNIMAGILEVRYTDLEEEKRLCHQLLSWAEDHGDSYAAAFALTYLGDYHIALYDEKNAGYYLMRAQEYVDKNSCWEELRLRVYSFLGIYYDMIADEQNAVDFYLKAVIAAEALRDALGECIALNNLAFVFQRHCCYEEALYYYRKAYQIQSVLTECPVRASLLGNMVDVTIRMGRFDDARNYIDECKCSEENPQAREIMGYKNWCSYYSAVGEREKALTYAALFLGNKEFINEDKLTAFETYHNLFQHMMNLGEGTYASCFLHAMEELDGLKSLEHQKIWEEMAIYYSLAFEPASKHAESYRRYYEKNQQFRARINEMITNAMKSGIHLEELQQQTRKLQSEQQTLEEEVNLDELTKVYSRRFLETRIRRWQQDGEESHVGFIILDIDYFKEYNDFYGHLCGDTVLKEIGSCLKEVQTEGIYPCRYGGDEFVCLCEGLTERQMETYIQAVTERLHTRALVHEKSRCSDKVTLSIGYALREERMNMEVHFLFQLADQALYESKRSGRNTYTRKRADLL